MTAEEFLQVMNQLDFYPVRAHRHFVASDASSSFFMKPSGPLKGLLCYVYLYIC